MNEDFGEREEKSLQSLSETENKSLWKLDELLMK